MIKVFKILLKIALFLALIILTVWGSLALWYRFPGSDTVRAASAVVFVLLGLATCIAQFTSKATRALIGYGVLFCTLALWWNTLTPPENGNWAPEVAQQVTGEFSGDVVTLTNVREFTWRSEDDFTETWTTRQYDLSTLETLDVFMSYWDSSYIAHIVVSFGFADGQQLAWSVEVRREAGAGFSPIADFFKEHTLVTVASVERDVVGLRSNIRGEDVQLYRMNVAPAAARALFEQYVNYSNQLSENAQWYNSVTTNCTTVIYKLLEVAGIHNKFDWRVLVNGYLPEYFDQRGLLNPDLTLEELRDLGRIAPRAMEVGLVPGYAPAVRVSVPVP